MVVLMVICWAALMVGKRVEYLVVMRVDPKAGLMVADLVAERVDKMAACWVVQKVDQMVARTVESLAHTMAVTRVGLKVL